MRVTANDVDKSRNRFVQYPQLIFERALDFGGGFGWVLGYSAFGPWFAGNDSVQLCFYKAMMIYGLVLLIALLLAFFAAIAG